MACRGTHACHASAFLWCTCNKRYPVYCQQCISSTQAGGFTRKTAHDVDRRNLPLIPDHVWDAVSQLLDARRSSAWSSSPCIRVGAQLNAQVLAEHAQAVDDPYKVLHVCRLPVPQIRKMDPLGQWLAAYAIGEEQRMYSATQYQVSGACQTPNCEIARHDSFALGVQLMDPTAIEAIMPYNTLRMHSQAGMPSLYKICNCLGSTAWPSKSLASN